MWRVVGRHLFLNIISKIFTTRTERKVWCDEGLRNWSHQPLMTSSVNISNYNSVKSIGPIFISEHNPSNFTAGTEPKIWRDRGMRPDASTAQDLRGRDHTGLVHSASVPRPLQCCFKYIFLSDTYLCRLNLDVSNFSFGATISLIWYILHALLA